MLDPNKQAAFDQAVAQLRETLPPLLGSFYNGLIAEGMDAMQALTLTNTYLMLVVRGNPNREE